MFSEDPQEEEKIRRQKRASKKTLNMIVDLLISNRFTTYELLALIKYLLDRYPYPLDKLPPAYLEILEGKYSPQKR